MKQVQDTPLRVLHRNGSPELTTVNRKRGAWLSTPALLGRTAPVSRGSPVVDLGDSRAYALEIRVGSDRKNRIATRGCEMPSGWNQGSEDRNERICTGVLELDGHAHPLIVG